MLAGAGRVAVVWLPTFAFSAGDYRSAAEAFLFSALITLAWTFGLRSAFTAAHSSFLAIGVIVSSAVGSALGLVLVSALSVWLPWIQLGAVELLQIAPRSSFSAPSGSRSRTEASPPSSGS